MSNLILRDFRDSSKLNSPSKGITRTFLSAYESVETIVNGFVSLVVNIFMFAITTLTPLAAPIAPAFSVYKALAERLETPFSIALAGAIAIEITGMFVAKTSIAAHNWNSARNKTDPEAPKALAITMAAIFFSVIFILSLTIELNPNLVIWIYPGFVIVAITVYVCLAISNNLKDWEQKKAQDIELRELKNGLNAEIRKAEKTLKSLAQNIDTKQAQFNTLIAQIETKQFELSKAQKVVSNGHMIPVKTTNLDTANKAKMTKIDLRRDKILTLIDQGLSQSDIADELEVSIATVKRDIKSLNGTVK